MHMKHQAPVRSHSMTRSTFGTSGYMKDAFLFDHVKSQGSKDDNSNKKDTSPIQIESNKAMKKFKPRILKCHSVQGNRSD